MGLQIGSIEPREIARDALLQLRAPPLDFALREVLVARVDGFELRAVDRNAGFRQQPHASAQRDKLGADFLYRGPIVLAEVGNGLVVGRKPLDEPDHFQIAPGLALQTTARLDAIQITVDVELQEGGGMIRGPTSCRRIDTIKAQLAKIERIDERIDRANRIALVDKIIEAFRQQRRLSPISPFNEPLHRLPPQIARRIITATAFLRSQGHSRRSA